MPDVHVIDLSDDDDDLPSLRSVAPTANRAARHGASQTLSRYSDIDSFSSSPILPDFAYPRDNTSAGPSVARASPVLQARARAPPVRAVQRREVSDEEEQEVPEVPEFRMRPGQDSDAQSQTRASGSRGARGAALGRGRGRGRGRGGSMGLGDIGDSSGTNRRRELNAQAIRRRQVADQESSSEEEAESARARKKARPVAPPIATTSGLAITPLAGPSRADSSSLVEKFADRDRERKEKAAEKAREKEAAKEAAKLAKQAEKADKKKRAEANKLRNSKSDTVREIKILISPDLEQKRSPLLSALPALRAKFTANLCSMETMTLSECHHMQGLMRFERFVQSKYDEKAKMFEPLPNGMEHWEKEDIMVIFITAKQLAGLVLADKTRARTRTDRDEEEGLHEWFRRVRGAFPARQGGPGQTILIIHGLKAYYGKNNSAAARAFEARALAAIREADGEVDTDGDVEVDVASGQVSREEIEMALLRLHIAEKCFQIQVETKGDMEDWIWNIAADLAIRPYKLIEKSHLAFSTREIPRKGKAPQDTYRLMLEEVPGITSSAASGIAEKFPSFRSLMEGFAEVEEKYARGEVNRVAVENMMTNAGCMIRNTVTGQENARKIGNTTSRHVHDVFRGRDGLALL